MDNLGRTCFAHANEGQTDQHFRHVFTARLAPVSSTSLARALRLSKRADSEQRALGVDGASHRCLLKDPHDYKPVTFECRCFLECLPSFWSSQVSRTRNLKSQLKTRSAKTLNSIYLTVTLPVSNGLLLCRAQVLRHPVWLDGSECNSTSRKQRRGEESVTTQFPLGKLFFNFL